MFEERILNDYKEAMKSRDSIKSSVLSMLRADFINTALSKKKNSLDDNEAITVVRKQVKQRQDSIEQFTKGGRMDLADKENRELEILRSYLPKELSADQIKSIIEKAIASVGAVGMKDMGKVMKEVTAEIAGKADSKTVSDLVKDRLSKN